jgi:iron(III) transport system ATP-binding protein
VVLPVSEKASSVVAAPQLLPRMTAREYLSQAQYHRGEAITDALLKEALELVRLPQWYLGNTPEALSSGQRKRVGLAVVWLTKCRLIVLDEPRANLDSPSKEMMNNYLRTLEKERRIVFLASHDEEDEPFAHHRLDTEQEGSSSRYLLKKVTISKGNPSG